MVETTRRRKNSPFRLSDHSVYSEKQSVIVEVLRGAYSTVGRRRDTKVHITNKGCADGSVPGMKMHQVAHEPLEMRCSEVGSGVQSAYI